MPATTATVALKDAVLDHLPGYRQSELRRNRLRKLIKLVPGEQELVRDYRNKIFAAADADVDTLDDLRQDYITDRAIWQGAAAFTDQVAQAIRQAEEDMNKARLTGATAALDYLRGELGTLMADVHKHRDVIAAHPTNARDVINGKHTAKNWNLVESLIARYDDLRAEHRAYVKLQGGNTAAVAFVTCGQIATFIDHDPHWLHRRATAPGAQSHVDEIRAWFTKRGGRTKAADIGRTTIWPTSYRPNQWLLTVADNQPWLPDFDTIEHAAHAADQLLDKPFRDASTTRLFHNTLDELKALAAPNKAKTPLAFNAETV